jgi:hypothetical protein
MSCGDAPEPLKIDHDVDDMPARHSKSFRNPAVRQLKDLVLIGMSPTDDED